MTTNCLFFALSVAGWDDPRGPLLALLAALPAVATRCDWISTPQGTVIPQARMGHSLRPEAGLLRAVGRSAVVATALLVVCLVALAPGMLSQIDQLHHARIEFLRDPAAAWKSLSDSAAFLRADPVAMQKLKVEYRILGGSMLSARLDLIRK